MNICRCLGGWHQQAQTTQMVTDTAEEPPALLWALEAQLFLILVLRLMLYLRKR